MATHRPTYQREDSISGVDPTHALQRTPSDVKTPSLKDDFKEKDGGVVAIDSAGEIEILAAENVLDNGKERPIETANDIATRCMSLEDDPTLPVFTFRMWFLGIGLTCFASVLGQIFYFRPQTVYVSQLFLQVIAYILGITWAKVLPDASRGKFWAFLNPGPFNIKEHVAILIMSSTGTESALAISVFAADELYYNIQPNYGVAIFTLLGSQLFGYGIAGLMRSFTVFPTYIVFPNLVPTVNLFDVLHRDKDVNAQKKRLRFFWLIFIIIFVWEWIPEFLAPTLTGISIFCLARRNSPWVTRIFGGANGNEGLGMFALCLDWNYVGSGGGSLGALFTPFSTQVSQYAGVALCCILFTTMYANNVWNAQNFPFLSQLLFYQNGTEYNQTLILNPDYSLNQTALDIQGTPWYSASNAMYYLGCNLAIGATLTHVGLWFAPLIVNAWKQWRDGSQPDPHYQKMRVYKEVPMWWYGFIIVSSFAMAMATAYTGHSQLPWWALIVALILASAVFPFVVIIYAVTGFVTDTQQLAQMLGSAIVPGNSQANLYFTLYGYNTVLQARGLTRDLKLGQYTKVPPRVTFMVQTVGTIIGSILQLIIMKSIISAQRTILLDVQGSNIWSGQQVQSYNSQAVAWGALAKSMYAPNHPYFIIPMSIIIGLFVPVPFWLLHKKFPKAKFDQVVTPITCWCLGYLSVGINSSVFTTMLVALFSQYYLRRYRATWFRKYNFLASAGLDGGTQFMSFIASFALFGAGGNTVTMPNWALNPADTNLDYCMALN
ncbi:peptide transporter MTD1 [Meredithblackwellia eburnea MCA 4105]